MRRCGTGVSIKISLTEESEPRRKGQPPVLSLRILSSPPPPSPSLLSPLLGLVSIEGLPQNMDTQRKSRHYNHPSLHLVTSATPAQPISTRVQNHKQSESPFRYLNERLGNERALDEKDQTPLADISSSSGRRASSTSRATHRSSPSNSRSPTPTPSHHRTHTKQSSQRGRPATPVTLLVPAGNGRGPASRRAGQLERSLRPSLFTRLQPWIPIILYGISSLGFVVAIAFWRTEIFQGMGSLLRTRCPAADPPNPFLGLDDLSHRLQEESSYGYGVIFLLIWITTFRKCRVKRYLNPRFSLIVAIQHHCHCTPPSSHSLVTLTEHGQEPLSLILLRCLGPSAFTPSAGRVSTRRSHLGYRKQRRSREWSARSRSDRSCCSWFASPRTRITS